MNVSESTRGRGDSSWRLAFAAGIGMSVLYIVLGYLTGPLHSQGTEAIIALVVPAVVAFPVGWFSEAPDLSCIGLAAGFMAPTLLWFIVSRAAEDLGPAIGALLMSLIIVPGSVFGIGCATLIKSMRRNGLSWPTPRGYALLAFMIAAALLVGRLHLAFHDTEKFPAAVVTQQRLNLDSVVARPGPNEPEKRESAKHYLLGVHAFQRQDFVAAAKDWKAAVKLYPDNADAHRGLERLGMDKGQ